MNKLLNALPYEIRQKYLGKIPVPIVAIARELGLNIYGSYDFKNVESGSIRKEKDGYNIYINPEDPPARRRFTVAHEIGHYLLHKNLLESGDELVETIKQPITQLNRSKYKKSDLEEQQREIEANSFAAALLMPEKTFKDVWQTSTAIEDLAEAFKVSPSAATLRAKELLGSIMI